ncbi:MAG: hypothetical protein AAGE52_32025 [Myxococcota bacterium]
MFGRLVAGCVLLAACTTARSGSGAECARNSECAAPLVCALERCRNECNTARDCPSGAICLRSERGVGVCRLADEAACPCSDGLLCVRDECTTSCDRGCAPGTLCLEGGCIDPAGERCQRDSDCGALVCVSGRCAPECLSDRDCRFGTRCVAERCVGTSAPDSGVDAGAMDTSPDRAFDADSSFCAPSTIDAVQVAMAANHGCAVLADGSVYCWGSNTVGQIGSSLVAVGSTATGSAFQAELSDAVEIAAGNSHTCARRSDGQVLCWGDNFAGICGVGRSDRIVITPEAVLDDATALAVGRLGSCALVGDAVRCWGRQDNGGLATSDTGDALAPVATDLGPTRAIAYGHNGGAAIGTGGDLEVWGQHASGEPAFAYAQPPFTDASAIALGDAHLCLLRPSGEVFCAGLNRVGQLGDPARDTTGGPILSFAAVPGLTDVVQIDAAGENTCARSEDGALRCWGLNANGSLGVGDSVLRTTPTPVALPGPATDIGVGTDASCAIVDGSVFCWGANFAGRLGFPQEVGSTREPTMPVECLP